MSSSLRQKLGKSIVSQATASTVRASPSHGAVVNYTQQRKYYVIQRVFRPGFDQQVAPQTQIDLQHSRGS